MYGGKKDVYLQQAKGIRPLCERVKKGVNMIKVKIRCSKCGQEVLYSYDEFMNVSGKPVCKSCLKPTRNMTNYINNLNKNVKG